MNITVGPKVGKLTVERDKPVKIELPLNEHGYVSVTKLTPDGSSDPETELLRNIKALEMNPMEPAFRIELKNGRSIWIRIGEDCLVINGYSGPIPCLPEQTVVPFPKNKE